MRRSSNPVLNARTYENARTYGVGETMTIQGTVNKTLIALFLLVASALWVWNKVMQPVAVYPAVQTQSMANMGPLMIGAFIGSIIAYLVTMFKKEWSAITVPIYAVFEGVLIGAISATFEMRYPGIVLQSVALTFGVLFCLLLAYKTGFVRVTQKFRTGMMVALGSICLIYVVRMVMGLFGGTGLNFLFASTPLGIGFSLVIVGVAALTLVLDFDFIERAAQADVPKYMEWYAAFGLLVSLVWLYLELLRLLSLIASRD